MQYIRYISKKHNTKKAVVCYNRKLSCKSSCVREVLILHQADSYKLSNEYSSE